MPPLSYSFPPPPHSHAFFANSGGCSLSLSLSFGRLQVEATKKQEEVWQALIPHIEAMELEDNVEGSGGHTEEAPGYMVGV